MVSTVRTRVDWVQTQSMFAPGGHVHRFAGKVEDDVRRNARLLAGRRSGDLRRSISASRHTLPLGTSFKVQAFAEHALWVEHGTAGAGLGRIYGHHFNSMHLYAGNRRGIPARYRKYKGARVRSVAGQRPKHFLSRGLRAGMAQNGLL